MSLPITISRLDGKSGNGTSLTSNSITPGDNVIVFAFVFSEILSASSVDPTITTTGLTWHTGANETFSLFSVISGRFKLAWTLTPASSGTFTVKADYGATSHNTCMILEKVTNAHPTAPIVQEKFPGMGGFGGPILLETQGFASPPTQGNAIWAGAGWLNDTASMTAGAGFTLLTPSVTLSSTCSAQTEWRSSIAPKATASLSGSVLSGMLGVEIQAAPDPSQIVGGTSVRHYEDSGVTYYEPLNIRRYSQGDVRRYDQ